MNMSSKPMKPWAQILIGVIFAIVGGLTLYFSSSMIKTYNEKNSAFEETTAVVVDYNYDDDGLQAIIVEYVVDGQPYRKTSNTYSSMPKSIGTEVSIKYNPANPKDAIWTNDSSNIILPAMGAVFTIVGIIVAISGFRKSTNHEDLTTV